MTQPADIPYEVLYVEHEPAARRLALSLVPPHAVDDVVAEAFTRVLASSARNGPPAAFRPYLLAAVRNSARNYHARGRRLVLVPDPQPGPVSGPLRALIEREDATLAGQAFAALPERWRQVLWATAVEEVSAATLARRWGMTANAVSQLASRAREGLRQAYLTAHLDSQLPPSCRAVAPYMGASVRGRAGQRHQAELTAHLGSCPGCAQAHAGLAAMNARLGGLGIPAAGLAAKLLPAAWRGWHLHLMAAAVVVTAGAGAGFAVTPFITHTGGPVRARAQAAVSSPGHGGASAIATAVPVRVAQDRPSADVAGVPAPATSAAPSASPVQATPGAGGAPPPASPVAQLPAETAPAGMPGIALPAWATGGPVAAVTCSAGPDGQQATGGPSVAPEGS